MPQEFLVIKCYSCETFQVHIVKKSNKWCCKMCGDKQSIKKIYYQGSGKDCRLQVQFLNKKRMTTELLETEACITQYNNTELKTQITQHNNLETNPSTSSKWSEFLTKENNLSDSDDSENVNFVFERPKKRKLITKSKNDKKIQKLSNFDCENSQTIGISSIIPKDRTVDIKTNKNLENPTENFISESENVFNSIDVNNLDEILNFDL